MSPRFAYGSGHLIYNSVASIETEIRIKCPLVLSAGVGELPYTCIINSGQGGHSVSFTKIIEGIQHINSTQAALL